jgi:3',5'-cyclic AMP phosphodiesterase CpdA
MFTIAHVSDTHFGNRPEAAPRVAAVLDQLLAMSLRPDVLVLTGDIADHGLEEEYAEAREHFARWSGPIVVGTGNHDARDAFAKVLLDREADGPLDQVLEVGGHRFLMLDSLVSAVDGTRIDHGVLTADSVAWLDAELSASDLPTFVCLHHSPVPVNITLMDDIQLREPGGLELVLARHPHVLATLVGHNHTACASTFAGRPVLIAGGVVSTVTLDAEPQPPIWNDAPPTFAFHLVDDTGRLTTHWRSLPV